LISSFAVAGLIKATLALHHKILPPTTGCDRPHAELASEGAALRVLRQPELWPAEMPVRAGVNGFGFGGINVHVTLEAADTRTRTNFTSNEQEQFSSTQDSELFIFSARNTDELSMQLEEALRFAGECSYSELTDLSATLARRAACLSPDNVLRAACVASSPGELEEAIRKLLGWCETEIDLNMDVPSGTFLGKVSGTPRIGFLFPGQASPVYTGGGIWARSGRGIASGRW